MRRSIQLSVTETFMSSPSSNCDFASLPAPVRLVQSKKFKDPNIYCLFPYSQAGYLCDVCERGKELSLRAEMSPS